MTNFDVKYKMSEYLFHLKKNKKNILLFSKYEIPMKNLVLIEILCYLLLTVIFSFLYCYFLIHSNSNINFMMKET